MLIGLIPLVGGVIALVFDDFIKSTGGANRFGDDPLAGFAPLSGAVSRSDKTPGITRRAAMLSNLAMVAPRRNTRRSAGRCGRHHRQRQGAAQDQHRNGERVEIEHSVAPYSSDCPAQQGGDAAGVGGVQTLAFAAADDGAADRIQFQRTVAFSVDEHRGLDRIEG